MGLAIHSAHCDILRSSRHLGIFGQLNVDYGWSPKASIRSRQGRSLEKRLLLGYRNLIDSKPIGGIQATAEVYHWESCFRQAVKVDSRRTSHRSIFRLTVRILRLVRWPIFCRVRAHTAFCAVFSTSLRTIIIIGHLRLVEEQNCSLVHRNAGNRHPNKHPNPYLNRHLNGNLKKRTTQ